jgi:hypothetical protein
MMSSRGRTCRYKKTGLEDDVGRLEIEVSDPFNKRERFMELRAR